MTRSCSALALVLALAALAAPSALAQERPTLIIGSPSFQPLPMAVADFLPDGDARAAQEATDVVRGDLALSGLFDVLDPKGFLADPSEGFAASSIRFARWADVGAEGLVRARVRREGTDLVADLHLYEVRAGRESLVKTLRAPAATPRAVGHRMADEIVRHYTREPGVFSTQIAAIRKARGVFELVLFDADGKNPRVLLSERTILLTPSWRPDGKEILLTSYRSGRPELWTLRLADRTFRKLSQIPNAMGGVYSPDGAHIAFTATEGGNSDVWVMAADGTGARRLTHEPALDLSPSWSPDGKRIAFVSDRAGTPQIYVMNADGIRGAPAHLPGQLQPDPAVEPARRPHRVHRARRAQGLRRVRHRGRRWPRRPAHPGPGPDERGALLGAERAHGGVSERQEGCGAARAVRSQGRPPDRDRGRRRRALRARVGPAVRLTGGADGRYR